MHGPKLNSKFDNLQAGVLPGFALSFPLYCSCPSSSIQPQRYIRISVLVAGGGYECMCTVQIQGGTIVWRGNYYERSNLHSIHSYWMTSHLSSTYTVLHSYTLICTVHSMFEQRRPGEKFFTNLSSPCSVK